MSDEWRVTSDKLSVPTRKVSSRHPSPVTPHASAFTLIEVMIVIAIIGLIAAMGVPSVFQIFRKEGMRRAVSDVQQLMGDARARAIYSGRTVRVVFHPAEKRLEIADAPAAAAPVPLAGALASNPGLASPAAAPAGSPGSVVLPDNVDIAMLDIDMLDRGADEIASVDFYPNGTCQELMLVLHSRDEWEKITLEFSTALASAAPVTR
ncbi:MAG TPA: prepilin-type N-terminal cleavage/methylation domain-containing protein [Candidatus Acidoferrum sp.]|nr:prepilin-type N-terminal cleavage/methylation domain-containing protein [Candidatus Acidoferrum sp.]